MTTRRKLLTGLVGAATGLFVGRNAVAKEAGESAAGLRFPGDPTEHNVIYQLKFHGEKESTFHLARDIAVFT